MKKWLLCTKHINLLYPNDNQQDLINKTYGKLIIANTKDINNFYRKDNIKWQKN